MADILIGPGHRSLDALSVILVPYDLPDRAVGVPSRVRGNAFQHQRPMRTIPLAGVDLQSPHTRTRHYFRGVASALPRYLDVDPSCSLAGFVDHSS
jgi:hypothetical protein